MARVSENKRSRHEEEREEMSPLATGFAIATPVAAGILFGLAIRSALSDAEVPYEVSQETIDRVEEFVNEDGKTFENYTVRGAVLGAVLEAAPWVKIPKDLDPEDVPGDLPRSPEAIIDFIEDTLDTEVSDKRAAKIRTRFEKLEREWDEKDKDDDKKSGSDSSEDEDEDEDDLAEDEPEEPAKE
jgi:hypothetical protein